MIAGILIAGILAVTLAGCKNTDTTKEIQTAKGMNILEIKNGMAYVTEADCPDQVCIRMGKISKTGENIVCLPHKLVIQVEGDVGQKSEYDNR